VRINNQGDWWYLCDTNWEHILDIFGNVGAPMGRTPEDKFWADRRGQPDVEHPKCLAQTLEDLRKARDGNELVGLFGKAWLAADDMGDNIAWAGWQVFNDLCRQAWVFHEHADANVAAPS